MNRKLRMFIIITISLMISGSGFALAWFVGRDFLDFSNPIIELVTLIATPLLFFIISLFIMGPIIDFLFKIITRLSNTLSKMPLQDIASGVFGLIIGLVIAALINTTLKNFKIVGSTLSIISTVFFGYLGWVVAYKRRGEIVPFFNSLFKTKSRDKEDLSKSIDYNSYYENNNNNNQYNQNKTTSNYKILDTSVIIDGRIADICRTGFIEGPLIIPNFVLDELRHIADSSDLLKRNRGRRGLDILKKLQEDFEDRVQIVDTDYPEISEVDSKLVKLTQDLNGSTLTNDFNLNKVAQLQGVKVLNINELSNALKPMLLPGEPLHITIIKEGKEHRQGIGYLDDGTMIVVEDGRDYIDQKIDVEVTSVLQTAAGRMIFARPLKK